MNAVDSCIVCGSKDLNTYNAQCSPFLAERIWGSEPFDTTLTHCNHCDFAFYNPRPEDSELDRLYANYRGVEYQQQRQKFEPGYTQEVNESLGHSTTEIAARKQNMARFLKGQVDYTKIKAVLDYGGDNGQFITPEFRNSEKYVYDISGVPLLSGVKRISSIDESRMHKFDFIMCCNVLEHVSSPNKIISNLLRFSHKGTVMYFEVPADSPINGIKRTVTALFQNYPGLYQWYSLVRGSKKPYIIFEMHEHINHLSRKSLQTLLKLHGIKTTSCDKTKTTIYCLAEVAA